MFEQFGNIMEMVKKVQQNVDTVQEGLKQERIEVSSGDVIKITVNGQQEVVAIQLNSKYLNADNAALLQDLLLATINNALSKSRDLNQAAMGKLATDLNLPKIPGMF
ncbi:MULTISPECIES: YbaB/EbfC family nucleoid-associated protein [Sporomusa]|uniref:Nucleoid-associated protein SSPH_00008 n=2 Tax=Sporomusa TaxID=2375 RepID=A0ABM9VXN9_9FIRM|nr:MULTISPECIES: YbaB/EbfC family nucleoid-associated protein [Sporomusa]MCM0758105.1 YbaB/EbfC family nucleoid-associated protein [Sporomusa sphaeroides DSM 2875]OLS58429.1 nucleoid-associated protein [Sporomusa sphaeroides DSM 2875]CVK17384.1 Nucleoid-associated protein [Sporomusa sphaeroides DSM 2875]SCM80210.1 Nucleoid-associated protein SOV_4c00830 [uncultured Sporomusa sp.]